jgi:dihydroxyacetone kinase-like protein
MKLEPADEITEMMALSIIEDEEYVRTVREWDMDKEEWVEVELVDPPFQTGDKVLAFVNSMGGTPAIELPIVFRKLHEICEAKGLEIVRNLIGPYITSLEMQGMSITLLKMDDEMLELWDAPVKTPGLRWGM